MHQDRRAQSMYDELVVRTRRTIHVSQARVDDERMVEAYAIVSSFAKVTGRSFDMAFSRYFKRVGQDFIRSQDMALSPAITFSTHDKLNKNMHKSTLRSNSVVTGFVGSIENIYGIGSYFRCTRATTY